MSQVQYTIINKVPFDGQDDTTTEERVARALGETVEYQAGVKAFYDTREDLVKNMREGFEGADGPAVIKITFEDVTNVQQ